MSQSQQFLWENTFHCSLSITQPSASFNSKELKDLADITNLEVGLNILKSFLDLCRLSLDVVEAKSQPKLHLLLREVISQYCHHILDILDILGRLQQPFESEVGEVGEVRELAGELASELDSPTTTAETRWIGLTIFDVTLAALAAEYNPGPGFAARALSNVKVEQWRQAAQGFLPGCVGFDTTNCLVGSSVAHWRRWRPLERWERDIRNGRFSADQKAKLSAVKEVVESLKKRLGKNTEEVVRQAERAIECRDLLPDVLPGTWWTMDPRTFQHKDQCGHCQATWSSVRLLEENAVLNPVERVSNSCRAWQCAEADIWARWQRQSQIDNN